MASKIAVIGTGAVGTTTAFACIMRSICAELLLVDIDSNRCQGEALDLADTLSFSKTAKISSGSLKQAAQADIIIITAGKPQQKGQLRSQLLQTNMPIIKQIAQELTPLNPQAIVIIVTNPVDTLTLYAQQLLPLPQTQVFGSGTMLESQRLRNALSERLSIAEESIHAYILGEHGETAFAALSAAHIGGTPLDQFIEPTELYTIVNAAIHKVYDIISCKGYTNFGVAACVAAACENITFDQNRVMPVSCRVPNYDICMSIPAIIGASGISGLIMPSLNKTEAQNMAKCAFELAQSAKLLA